MNFRKKNIKKRAGEGTEEMNRQMGSRTHKGEEKLKAKDYLPEGDG